MSAGSTAPSQAMPHASPFKLFRAISAYQLTESIRAGVELNIFSAIGAGHKTTAAIAQECQVAERGARILCD